MGVYISYPKADAFITTEFPDANTGKDEILSLGSFTKKDGTRVNQRVLIQPDTDLIRTKLAGEGILNQESFINLKTTRVQSIPQDLKIYTNIVTTQEDIEWVNGVGKLDDSPKDTSGVSWKTITGDVTYTWVSGSLEFPLASTGSFSSVEGGGTWLSGSLYEYTTSIISNSSLDLELDITDYIYLVESGSISDRGLIVRLDSTLENSNRDYTLNYFSRESNTIFLPTIHTYYNDQVYETGNLEQIGTHRLVITSPNLQSQYRHNGVSRFDLHVRPQHPVRKFTTGSIYLEGYSLPENSVWKLEDYYSGEEIIPFRDPYTRVNCDSEGPYIELDLGMIQPERFYRFVVKAVINNTTITKVLDPFKITRHGQNY